MQKLTVFYLNGCPYCRKAREAVEALLAEDPAFKEVEMEWIEETECAEVADSYDYYRVPSIFLGREKLYECSPADDYETIKQNFECAMRTGLRSPRSF